MQKYLILAEKPSLMRDIRTAYNSGSLPYEAHFDYFVGHVMELKHPEAYSKEWGKPWKIDVLPMIPDKFQYSINPKQKKRFNDIKSVVLSGKYDYIVNACDAGREGEAIFWTFYYSINCKLPVKRLWASDTTKETLLKALKNLLDYKKDGSLCALRESSLCRMNFDWLIGMNFTRAATLKSNMFVPIGRVQTPTLSIVVKRDLEIDSFKPTDYYEIVVDYGSFQGRWIDKKTGKHEIKTKKTAQDIVSKLHDKAFVLGTQKEKQTEYAPCLFSLPELQKEANKKLGLTSKKTLEIAQALYEKHKLITYPRTESKVLSTSLSKEITQYLNAVKDCKGLSSFVQDILKDPERIKKTMSTKKYVNNAKVTDHHAIINTKTTPDLSKLSKEEKSLYLLIASRFVSIFLDPRIIEKTAILTKNNNEIFRSTGIVVLQEGFTKLLLAKNKDTLLPVLTKNQQLDVKEKSLEEKQTSPPPRYTDSTLISAMQNAGKFSETKENADILKEAMGIGTAATRDTIIEKLVHKGFLERNKKNILSTKKGKSVVKAFYKKDFCSPDLTASWEKKLKEIEDEKISKNEFDISMRDYVENQTKDLLDNTNMLKHKNEVIGNCPGCNGQVYFSGKHYFCENKHNKEHSCNFSVSSTIGQVKIPKEEILNILDKKKTSLLTLKNKQNKKYTAKLYYNEEEKDVKFYFGPKKRTKIGSCIKCGRDVFLTDKFALCENYKKETNPCSFIMSIKAKYTDLSEEDVKSILAGGKSGFYTFENKKGDSFISRLYYNKDHERVQYSFTDKIIDKCLLCKSEVVAIGKYIACRKLKSKKDPCPFLLFLKSTKYSLDAQDANDLISGKKTKKIKIKENNSTIYYASLKYNKDKHTVNEFKGE